METEAVRKLKAQSYCNAKKPSHYLEINVLNCANLWFSFVFIEYSKNQELFDMIQYFEYYS